MAGRVTTKRPKPLPPIELTDEFDYDCAKRLGVAVIKQAFLDILAKTRSSPELRIYDENAAKSFLTASAGAWADQRRFWCAVAEIDPNVVQQSALHHIWQETDIKEVAPRD